MSEREQRLDRVDRKLAASERGLGLQEDIDIERFAQPDTERVVMLAPAKQPRSIPEWIHENLFSSWWNAALTVAAAALIAVVLYQAIGFVFFEANWAVIGAHIRGYMIGPFPLDEVWRIWLSFYLVAGLAGLSIGSTRPRLRPTPRNLITTLLALGLAATIAVYTIDTLTVALLAAGVVAVVLVTFVVGYAAGRALRKPLMLAWALSFPAIIVIVVAFDGVSPRLWGGFFFNIIAATVGIFASFPIGILLALGRRSELPAIRVFSIGFIELFRGVPLVAWLIFSKYVVGLLLPPQLDLPDIVRAFIAMTLFSAAYVGEIVRGGVQGVPHGQYEAARAVGLSTSRMMALIVMPQALRATIPAMISHFISLFKDTALFVAIEVTDLLAAAFRSASSLEFLQTDQEVLLFAALVFWSVAFSMSRWSQRLETRLGVGER